LKTKLALGARDIETPPGLTIRLGCIPDEFAFKPRQFT
jgi:hypothetical protein